MKKLVPSLAAACTVAVVATGSAFAAHSVTAQHAAAAPAQASTVLQLKALASGLKFDKKILRAKAGKVTVKLTNLSPLKHDVVIEAGEKILAKSGMATKGHPALLTVTLKKGSYHFVCDVPGHEDAGMSGTLVVS